MRQSLIAVFILLSAGALFAQGNVSTNMSGYVTRVASPTDFDVDGVHVLIDAKTVASMTSGERESPIPTSELKLYPGQPAQVRGELRKKEHSIAAVWLSLKKRESREVIGFGIVDAVLPVPADGSSTASHMVRADGYLLLIAPNASMEFLPPLTADSAFQTNVWAKFHGRQRADGVVVAEAVSFSRNTVSESEDKLRSKTEHDPAHKDDAMQARVSAIGEKLVPKYQRDLPDTDETKIHFRFQVVSHAKWHDAQTLPNGIILVPYEAVERLQNDSQLAAVLADNIACALEKQDLNMAPAVHKLNAIYVAGLVGGAVVPGMGVATTIGTRDAYKKLAQHNMEQSGRVSLGLLRDAGYDINQAPLAWWLLAPAKAKKIEDIPIPARAVYLYKVLGETW
jgi:hypothetical protein